MTGDDGMTASAATGGEVDAAELLRADLYDTLATLLVRPPARETLAAAAGLRGDEGPLGAAVAALAKLAAATGPEEAEREYNALFIGLGRGELLPFASFYLTGFLHEKPLAKLRADMARLGAARAPGVFEPEDHIASLCEIMAGLIRGRFASGPAAVGVQRDFFATHLGPWAAHFFTDLEAASSSRLYAPVGAMGRAFMEIERDAFRMEALERASG